jgi:hydroxymethylpyrimidine/phosphomethylpyrimidine kinase
MKEKAVPVCLTVAGSDSGGGAGIQADLKAFRAFGVHGTSAVTCLTAQNPDSVTGVEPVSPGFVSRQIETVCDFFRVSAVKTGMVYSPDIISAVAGAIEKAGISQVVIDPVMVATSGARLLSRDALQSLAADLLPLATVITPNTEEAQILWEHPVSTIADMEEAALEISRKYRAACVIKGGHEVAGGEGDCVDVLGLDGKTNAFRVSRVEGVDSHGSGCAFASSIAACLAKGLDVREAVESAKHYINQAISFGRLIGPRRFLDLNLSAER